MAGLFGADTNREIAFMAVAADRDLALNQPLRALAGGSHHVVEFGQHVRQRMIQRFGFGMADEFLSGAVENADAARGIDANDTGAGRGQHRLDEAPAAVDQVACAHSSSRWVRSSCVILLKVSPSWARSPSERCTATWTCRSPVETMLAALISRRIGATSQLAKFSPIRIDAIRIVSAITAKISAKLT